MQASRLSAVAALFITALGSGAAEADGSGFQLIIRQSGGETTGINLVLGQGENVQFYSSLDSLGVDWTEDESGLRTAIIDGDALDLEGVVLGVCAGGNCRTTDAGVNFSSPVGLGLR